MLFSLLIVLGKLGSWPDLLEYHSHLSSQLYTEVVQTPAQVALVDHKGPINLIDVAAKVCGEAQVSLNLFKESQPLFGTS